MSITSPQQTQHSIASSSSLKNDVKTLLDAVEVQPVTSEMWREMMRGKKRRLSTITTILRMAGIVRTYIAVGDKGSSCIHIALAPPSTIEQQHQLDSMQNISLILKSFISSIVDSSSQKRGFQARHKNIQTSSSSNSFNINLYNPTMTLPIHPQSLSPSSSSSSKLSYYNNIDPVLDQRELHLNLFSFCHYDSWKEVSRLMKEWVRDVFIHTYILTYK